MVVAADLRNGTRALIVDSIHMSIPETEVQARQLLVQAEILDEHLAKWAYHLPSGHHYRRHTVEQNQSNDKFFQRIIHIYPTAGHAGMWNRYRVLRLTTNDSILKCISIFCDPSESDLQFLKERALSRIAHLFDDLCASIPYVLGFVRTNSATGQDSAVTIEISKSLKDVVKATSASMLAWPLTMASFVDRIPQRYRLYFADRLRDVGEIVDDGTLGRVAAGFVKAAVT